MTLIPGTATSASFYTFGGKFPPLFAGTSGTDGDGPALGSLNAGNPGLWVDGGGINAGFKKALRNAGQNTAEYQTRHTKLLAATAKGAIGTQTYADTDPIQFSNVINEPLAHEADTGLSFIDVFGDERQPHGNPRNVAMIYTTPPDGRTYATRDAFLDDVEATAAKMIHSVTEHNALADEHGVPALAAVRMCLYSSGIFNAHFDDDGTLIVADHFGDFVGADGQEKPQVDLDVIALRIYAGLVTGLTQANSGLTEIQFPYTSKPHDPLFAAVRDELVGDDEDTVDD